MWKYLMFSGKGIILGKSLKYILYFDDIDINWDSVKILMKFKDGYIVQLLGLF